MSDDVNMDDMEEQYVPEGGIRIGDIYIPPPPAPACSMDSTGPRLIITHIENHFFKSYAGNQTLGPFHKSFTSIVGPNGSGKSNVIDSMLFVFGYRAQKIRSKKLSVLIHNSEKYPNVQSCTVSVHFQEILDKGDDFEEVPNTKLVVSRTAYKDNSSFYQVNGKRCQFKDVAKLLREKGIDLDHNRFLILQGEVESISLMKPKALTEHDTGMLEFLEDIIGTSRFKTPIEMLEKRVGELTDLHTEKLNRLKLVEKEKDELEGPMKEAVGFLKMENKLVEMKNKMIQKEMHVLHQNLEANKEKKAEIEASVADISEKLKEVQGKRKEKEKKMNAEGEDLAATTKRVEELKEKFRKMDLEDTTLKEDMVNTNKKRKKVIQLKKLEEEKQEKLKSLPEDNREKITECLELQEKLEKKLEEEEVNYEKAMTSLRQETQVYQDEKEKHENKLMGLRKGVDATQSDLTVATNELNIYTSAEQKEKIRMEQLENSIHTTRDQTKVKEARLKELEKLVPAKEKEQHDVQKQAQETVTELNQVKDSLQTARMEYEEKKSAQNASKSHGRVHDALMQQKKNGNIPGIIARLGDLGAIDKKYDVAISTAAGSSLDTILVDTVTTGKQCIEFLRKHNIGRGNFLALEKTQRWQSKADMQRSYPLGALRLFDLIKVKDDSVRTAFYHYLRETLVGNDIQHASKVAYGAERFRVVTLKGEVIETSGTMSGGGRALSGKMGQQVAAAPAVDPREMKRMETNIESLDQRHRELYNLKQKLENDMDKLAKEIRDLTKEKNKLSVEVNPLKDQLAMLEKQVAQQQQRVKETAVDKKKVAELEKVVKAAETKYHAACEKAEEVEREVKSCDDKIKEIMGSKVKSVQRRVDETRRQLEKMKKEITRLEVEIKSGERDLKKCLDKIESLQTEVTECEEGISSIQERRKALEQESGLVMEEMKEGDAKAVEIAELIKQLKKEVDEISKEENSLKSNRIEVDMVLEKMNEEDRDNNNKIAISKRDLKRLKLQEIPDEEITELKTFTTEELEEMDQKELKQSKETLEEKINAARPNMAAIAEYRKKEEVYLTRVDELDKVVQSMNEQKKHFDDLRKQRMNDFMDGFTIITGKLKEMYQMITLGGDAELELMDSLDPFSEGIVFSVRPPKKSWKNISNLSGGEKTLSSLALVFALHYYKPTPLYVMDEIDAALDFKNVSIVANYIKERTRNAQFIIISLRSNMFELADRLVGIYKTYNCTKSATLDPYAVEALSNPVPVQSQKVKETSELKDNSQVPVTNGLPLLEKDIN